MAEVRAAYTALHGRCLAGHPSLIAYIDALYADWLRVLAALPDPAPDAERAVAYLMRMIANPSPEALLMWLDVFPDTIDDMAKRTVRSDH